MVAPKTSIVAPGQAQSVQGATVGFCDATTSVSDERVDLSTWAGRYVKIYCESADHYFCFSASDTETIETGAQVVGTLAVADRVDQGGQGVHVVVPVNAPILVYRTVSGAGVLRVLPS